MKLHYFNQPAADGDDSILKKAIDNKTVPATCLLGGRLIEAAIRCERKPCDTCNGPRDRCKGSAPAKQKGNWERYLLTGHTQDPLSKPDK